MDRDRVELARLERDLHHAIERGEIQLQFQPIVACQSGDVHGYEALMRWKHPDRGMVPPSRFIPIAEENGLIVKLGAWVLEMACREAMHWPADCYVSVNISAGQFHQLNFAQTIAQTLKATGLPPERLVLEVTESVLISDTTYALEMMQMLASLGIRIALDDFGTGYSGLSYLRQFPIQMLKIDRSFIQDLAFSQQAGAIVRTIVDLGRALNLLVVAEGIETQIQFSELRTLNCGFVQGYWITRPIAGDDIQDFSVEWEGNKHTRLAHVLDTRAEDVVEWNRQPSIVLPSGNSPQSGRAASRRPADMSGELLAKTLDGLGIAICVLDFEDRATLWNDTFLRFFPEHAGKIFTGEHYRDNLRRFYEYRLAEDEMDHIDRYIERGIARHRSQTRPFTFEHRGRWVRVAVQTVPEIGRIRTWTQISAPKAPDLSSDPGSAGGAFTDSVHQASVQELPDAISVLAPSDRILSHNDQFMQLYGLSLHDHIIGSTYEDIVRRIWRRASPDASDDKFETEVLPLLREEQRFAGAAFEVPLPHERWVRVIEQRNADGLRSCVHFEISQFKREHRKLQIAEADARAREARFRAVIELSPVGMSIAKPNGHFVEINEAYGRVFGYKPNDLVGHNLWDIIDPAYIGQTRSYFEDLATGRITSMEHETKFLHRDGSERWVIHSAVQLREDDGQQALVISQIQDITTRKQIEAERDALLSTLAHRATHDSLTELPNRAHFEQRLQAALTESMASGISHTVCFIDLDNFKIINDTAGHLAGDTLLKQVGTILQEHVPADGLISRIGGDEFGLLLPNRDVSAAELIAHRLIAAIKGLSLDWDEQRFTVGMSIGIAGIDRRSSSISETMKQADEACYAAKRAGRNCVRIYAVKPRVMPNAKEDGQLEL